MNFIAVAIGGAIGATLRYALALLLAGHVKSFPTSTFLANLIGCFLIGVVSATTMVTARSESVRMFISVGALGGFTTFSAFGLETHMLLRESRFVAAATYVVLSLVLGLAAVFVGHRIGGRIGV